tara:strand:- start:263 stop:1144 length:882 start_codon:yes stop_codon:yes gene_type:complete
MKQPKYPVYIISKGRHDCCLTADFFLKDGLDFKIVIEPQEYKLYKEKYDPSLLITTPFSNLGLGGIPVRNFVWEDSIKKGHRRHWIFDDNIRAVKRKYKKTRIYCNSVPAIRACESFIDRYTNIGIGGMNYTCFAVSNTQPPFYLNNHVYSCLCIDNSLPFRWRGRYNEDTDLCLQVLSSGLCTVLFNAFLIEKMRTMTMKGGNMAQLYQGDGRLTMARSLERVWPGVVSTNRRFGRPQHVVKNSWRHFDTPLIRRTDIDWDSIPESNEFGMSLKQKRKPKSGANKIKHLLKD